MIDDPLQIPAEKVLAIGIFEPQGNTPSGSFDGSPFAKRSGKI